MKLILKQTVDTLGVRGQIVEVKPGYARNYLVPKGMAVPATPGNITRLENERKIIEVALVKERNQAEEVAEKIEALECTIAAKAGEGDRLYGSVTNMDVAEAMSKLGVEIDRRKILLDDPIKSLGEHTVMVKLHPEVSARMTVNVIKE